MEIFFLILAILACVYAFWDCNKWIKEQDAEDEAFERRRIERQKELDNRSKRLAKYVLIRTCESIYVGGKRNG